MELLTLEEKIEANGGNLLRTCKTCKEEKHVSDFYGSKYKNRPKQIYLRLECAYCHTMGKRKIQYRTRLKMRIKAEEKVAIKEAIWDLIKDDPDMIHKIASTNPVRFKRFLAGRKKETFYAVKKRSFYGMGAAPVYAEEIWDQLEQEFFGPRAGS